MSRTILLHVGDQVRFVYAPRKITGTVKEDRGPIGIKGRQLYLVAFSLEPTHSSLVELPADDLELVGIESSANHGA